MSDADNYHIERASHRVGDQGLLLRWRELLAESESPGRLYQSPEFFDYLQATATDDGPPELLLLRERAGGAIVGVIPIALRRHSFDFAAGRRQLARVAIPSIVLLGSAPLMPARTELFALLLRFLLAEYPRHQAVSLTALPQDSTLWRCISGTGDFARGYRLHLLNDWRDCHQIPLPASFEHFMSQFSSKRRYNLKRQQRQLRDHGQGRLDFHCIEHPGQLDMLHAALAALTTPAHRGELWTEADLLGFARRGMLLCYQLDCGGQACALMLGLRSGGTLYLFNVLHDSALDHLSVGTTMLHLAIEDLCDRRHFSMIDLGYGTPGHSYQSTNVTVRRAHLLLMRRNLRNRLASQLHHGFSSAIDWLKKNKKR
jgi:CelD/BcsL family acetyltransferase involved in cellulose biosynthesis